MLPYPEIHTQMVSDLELGVVPFNLVAIPSKYSTLVRTKRHDRGRGVVRSEEGLTTRIALFLTFVRKEKSADVGREPKCSKWRHLVIKPKWYYFVTTKIYRVSRYLFTFIYVLK
jgi:hypothetical protein